MRDFGEELGKVNQSLDKVQIRQKGDRLYLRATLPAKPGDGEKPKRYELSAGYGAHSEGLRFAKAKALEIEGQLLRENAVRASALARFSCCLLSRIIFKIE